MADLKLIHMNPGSAYKYDTWCDIYVPEEQVADDWDSITCEDCLKKRPTSEETRRQTHDPNQWGRGRLGCGEKRYWSKW